SKHKSTQIPPKIHHLLQQNQSHPREKTHTPKSPPTATKLYPAQNTNPHKYRRKSTTYCNKTKAIHVKKHTPQNPHLLQQ
ncbi:hypothetical protein, partial [Corynebacterium pyruviciproducens]|uniref:hypothetical protein n=1 Tax=Corynebacterium pyruviciproducens TaxID=598660 RepID=UPI0023F09A17